MFTIHHAVAFVAVFAFGALVGYAIGKLQGRDEVVEEIEEWL